MHFQRGFAWSNATAGIVLMSLVAGCPAARMHHECLSMEDIYEIASVQYSPRLDKVGFRKSEFQVKTNSLPRSSGTYLSVLTIWRKDGVPVHFVTTRARLPGYLSGDWLMGIVMDVPEYVRYLRNHDARVPHKLLEGPDGGWLSYVRPDFSEVDRDGTGSVTITRWEYGVDDVMAFSRWDFETNSLRRLMYGARYCSPLGIAIDQQEQWDLYPP